MEEHSESFDEEVNDAEYKGRFNQGDDDETEFYEHGAHFPYKALYSCLEELSRSEPKVTNDKNTSKEKHQILMIKNINLYNNSHQSRNINVFFSNNKNDKKHSNYVGDKNLLSLGNTNKNNIKKNLAISSLTIVDKQKKPNNNQKDKKAYKNIITKQPVKTTAKIDLNDGKKLSRPANSLSVSKKKTIKSISNSKNKKTTNQQSQNIKIPNNSKSKQHLSCSYQNLNLHKIVSPQKNLNNKSNNGISNIKYIKIQSKPRKQSPKAKPISKSNPNLTTTHKVTSKPIVTSTKSKNIKSRNQIIKLQPKKEDKKDNVTQTFHKSNSKENNNKNNIIVKPKPHSQEKPKVINNISISHKIKHDILKKNQLTKPLSASIASSSSLKPNNKKKSTNSKITLNNSHNTHNLHHNNIEDIKVQIVKNDNKPKKNMINNLTTIQIPLQPPHSSSSSQNKKISSRNNNTNSKINKTQKTNKNTTTMKNKLSSNIISNSTNKKSKQIDSSKVKTKCNSSISNGSKKNKQVTKNIKSEVVKI